MTFSIQESRTEEVLRIRDLRVYYRGDVGLVKAVDGVAVSIERGSSLALVGESGSGKTTLGHAVMGLLPFNAVVPSGEILFSGSDILKMSREQLRRIRGDRITMVFQEPSAALNPVFKISSFLRDVLRKRRGASMSEKEIREESIKLLRSVRIPSPEMVLDRYPHELSGGMKQRVLIAAAIANNPDLIVLDEPTSALDVSVQAQILRLLDELRNKMRLSLLFITHNLGVAAQVSEKVAVMYAGKIVEIAPTEVIFERPLHPYTTMLMKTIPSISKEVKERWLEAIPGAFPDLISPPPGCRFHPRCPRAMDICSRKEPELVEVERNHFVACHLY
ncbi:MAG: ABC transporter ATP-binding protein, partial [Fervidicoccaceae archaeon]